MGARQTVTGQARERLLRAGIRPTRQRLRVLEELAREPHDATAQALHLRLRGAGEPIALATVYRTLAVLVEHGVIDTLAHSAGETCYRLCGDQHHHHLVCSSCHRIVEIPECGLDAWLERVAAAADFLAVDHRVEVVGLCAACR